MLPRITTIIPTRERCDTLIWALKTCVTQDYDNYQIIVSDNASADETREVVASYDDSRVRYVNPGERLGMSEHWEFAFSQVDHGYVGVIGDDDGVMPDGISRAAEILGDSEAPALVWPIIAYYWPGFVQPRLANHLSLRVPRRSTIRRLDAHGVLTSVAKFHAPYYDLPSPYWGFVNARTLDAIRSRSGRLFWSTAPDIYAGAAVAAVVPHYDASNVALTLSGSSHHSNGARQGMALDQADTESPGAMFVRENTTAFHPRLDYSGSIPVGLAEALLQVSDHVDAEVPIPGLVDMMHAALRHEHFLFNPASQPAIIESLRVTARRNGLEQELDAALRDWSRQRRLVEARAALHNLVRGNPIHACPETVTNVYDASRMAGRIMGAHQHPLAAATQNVRGRGTKIRRALEVVVSRN